MSADPREGLPHAGGIPTSEAIPRTRGVPPAEAGERGVTEDRRPEKEPVLVLAAHGTVHPEGPGAFEELAERVRHRLPATEVVVAFVDVIGPTLRDVLASVCRDRGRAVVVPVFLGSGYHVEIDIPGVVAAYDEEQVVVARSLGPAPEVIDAVADRFRESLRSTPRGTTGRAAATRQEVGHSVARGQATSHDAARWIWRDGSALPDVVVLAAAGSTNAGSRQQTRTAADHLAAVLDRPVTVGFLTAGTPKVADVVERAHRDGSTVGIATYLLGPGTFHDRLRSAGPDVVAEPIGPHPLLADLVASRYREAVELPVAAYS